MRSGTYMQRALLLPLLSLTLVLSSVLVRAGLAEVSDPILVGAGDIVTCRGTDDEATAALLDAIGGTVFTAGDSVYSDGTSEEFANCYEPSWGRHKARTRPAVGNHEYHTPGAAGYFAYFGEAAGDPSKGYYSYDLGAWHIVVINSNCDEIGGCEPGSPQEQWLRADLAAHPTACTLAYWHHPLFSSGQHGSDTAVRPICRHCTRPMRMWSSMVMTITTSASRPKIPAVRPILRGAFVSLWSVRAVPTGGRSPSPSLTARFAMRIRLVSSG